MKTIFITSFEGVETKNLLRTSILPTILNSEKARVVILTHDQSRADYHKRELPDERVIYEIVPKKKIAGLNKLFSKLKFILLNTSTKDVHRKMQYEKTKNPIQYFGGLLANRMLARKTFRNFFRFLDLRLIQNPELDVYFKKYNPSLVVLANVFNEPEMDLLRAAKKKKIKSVGFVNSWDKVTAKCVFRLLPDKIIVFNDIVKKEVMVHDDAKESDIFVGGMPQYDFYFSSSPVSREEFFKKRGLAPSSRLVVYAPLGKSVCDSDWPIIDFLHSQNQAGIFGENIKILVRFPPHDFIDQKEIELRPWLVYDHPGVRFGVGSGGDWDMSFADLFYLRDTLANMSLLVGYASSVNIDAAIFDKPVISIDFEIEKSKSFSRSPLRYRKVVHCQTLRQIGGARVVQKKEDLVFWMKKYLEDSSIDKSGRKEVVNKQCVFSDGKSGERIGSFILSLIN